MTVPFDANQVVATAPCSDSTTRQQHRAQGRATEWMMRVWINCTVAALS